MLHFHKKAGLISGLFPCYENSIYIRKVQAPWNLNGAAGR
ncbi:hypothetical protein J2S78_001197 [Salibacterium salarium]|nr:hypothetical protein [Salibacterium salarium]